MSTFTNARSSSLAAVRDKRKGLIARVAIASCVLFWAIQPAASRVSARADGPTSFPAPVDSGWVERIGNRSLPIMVRALGDDERIFAPVLVTPSMRVGADEGPSLDDDLSLARAALIWPLRRVDTRPGKAAPEHASPAFVAPAASPGVVVDVLRAANRTAMDPAVMMAIAEVESNFSPSVKARTSSASGLYQFVENTWLQALRSFGDRHGHGAEAYALSRGALASPVARQKILQLRNDPYLSAALAGELLARDGARLSKMIGRRLTAGEIYLIHFLGVGDATRFIRAKGLAPNLSAATLFPKPAQANQAIFYERRDGGLQDRSVSDVYAVLENMMGKRASRYRGLAARLPANVTAYAP